MWSALQHFQHRLSSFTKRHRWLVTSVCVGSVVLAGGYVLLQRVAQESDAFSKRIQQQLIQHQRLQKSLASATEESNAAIRRFLPRLRQQLYTRLDLESVVKELRSISNDKSTRSKRHELWEQAKKLALTRYFTSIVSVAMWHLLVFAQIGILGRRVYDESSGMDQDKIERNVQAKNEEEMQARHGFLASGLEYFLDDGVRQIQEHVESVIDANQALQSWQVAKKPKVEQDELNVLLHSICSDLLPDTRVPSEMEKWRSFLIYPDKKAGQGEQEISLLNDLWDLLESELFAPALQQTLETVVSDAIHDMNRVVYGGERFEEVTNEPRRPPSLAKLIPVIQSENGKVLATGEENYLDKYSSRLAQVRSFREFYEAVFFQGMDDDPMLSLI